MNEDILKLDEAIYFMKSHIEAMKNHVADYEAKVGELEAKRRGLLRRKHTTEDCVVAKDPTFVMTWPVN